jgi:hypothetical protein
MHRRVADFGPDRSTAGFGCVKLGASQQGGLSLMAMETHLAELERRHKALEREIEDALHHPGVDTLALTELKRKKLVLKDEIARLKSDEAVH